MVMLYECRDDMFGRYTQNNVRKGATRRHKVLEKKRE